MERIIVVFVGFASSVFAVFESSNRFIIGLPGMFKGIANLKITFSLFCRGIIIYMVLYVFVFHFICSFFVLFSFLF